MNAIKNRKAGRYVLTFLILTVLCSLLPYSLDDWAWGSSVGINRLNTWFEGYSGRYVGNLIVLALTRSVLLRAVIMAGVFTMMVWILTKIASGKKDLFAFTCLLLLLTPREIFRQAVVWTSGFANYTISIFFTLIYVNEIRALLDGKKETKNRIPRGIFLFILGAVSAPVMEHLAIYNLVLAMAVLIYDFVTTRKVWFHHAAYLLGTLCGTIYMFSNSAYHNVMKGTDGYRSISGSQGILYKLVSSWFSTIYTDFLMSHGALNLLLAALCIFLFFQAKKPQKFEKLFRFCLSVITLYGIYSAFSSIAFDRADKRPELLILEGLFSILYFIMLTVYILWIGIAFGCIEKLAFLMGSLMMVTAPLLAVNPVTSRCLFAPYCFWILLALQLFQLLELPKQDSVECLIKKALHLGIAAGMLFYSIIFITNFCFYQERIHYVQAAADRGETRIELRKLPYEEYVWKATPQKKLWADRYKQFYGLDKDIKLVPVKNYGDSSAK